MNGKKIRIGIVGAGFITNLAHLPNWARFPDAEVIALCDTDNKRLAETCSSFRIRNRYSDVTQMLDNEKLDLVDVCTPPASHTKIASLCLAKGVNCSVEKPITVSTDEVDELVRLSNLHDVRIFPLHTYSYLPCVRKYKSYLQDGKLGNIVRVSTSYYVNLDQERYTNKEHWVHSLPGGVLNSEITPHLLMLIIELMGNFDKILLVENESISKEKPSQPEIEIILMNTVSTGTIGLSFSSHLGMQIGDILGTRGYIHTDFFAQTTVFHEFRRNYTGLLTRGLWATTEITQRIGDLVRMSLGSLTGRYTTTTEGHRFLFSKIIENLQTGTQYPVKVQDAREVVRAMEQLFANYDVREPRIN